MVSIRLALRKEMKRYDPQSRCPKCGHTDAAVKYDRAKSMEVLRRTCRCGYEWTERPLDSKIVLLKCPECGQEREAGEFTRGQFYMCSNAVHGGHEVAMILVEE